MDIPMKSQLRDIYGAKPQKGRIITEAAEGFNDETR